MHVGPGEVPLASAGAGAAARAAAAVALGVVGGVGAVAVGGGAAAAGAGGGGGGGLLQLLHDVRGLVDLGAGEDGGDFGRLLHGQDALLVGLGRGVVVARGGGGGRGRGQRVAAVAVRGAAVNDLKVAEEEGAMRKNGSVNSICSM